MRMTVLHDKSGVPAHELKRSSPVMNLLRRALMSLAIIALGASAQGQDIGVAHIGDQPTSFAGLMPVGSFVWSDGNQAATPGCNPCGPCCNDKGCNYARFGLFGEILYMKMHNADVPYAQSVDGLGDQALPTSAIGQVDTQYRPAYRFGLWFSPMELLAVRAQYLNYTSNGSNDLTAPDGDILRSLVTHPNTANDAIDSLTANASVHNELKLIDVDALVRISDCGAFTLYGVGGVRFAELKQEFHGQFSILGTTDVITHSNFDGAGPRLGLEGQAWVCGGFGVYGKTALNLLIGDFRTSYHQENTFQNLLVDTGFTKSRVVPNLELEVGGSWCGCCDHVRISAGYLISSWSNVVSTNGLIDAVQQNAFTQNRENLKDTVIFDGFVVRLEVRF
jgi:hypothetical protein